ncbi:uncharacterized protein LOC100678554 [Nasonia vitripennis]|uniref:Uncharacterized protein n=1 Tax=Nasonia vitripennis TaxID=7425 RepID=A0A7M7GDK7_NASVI|nr:uncharacterized protein LOC100678554 [Nasonia vitripennis]
MGRKTLHAGWSGFSPIKNVNGLIDKAQCLKCKRIFAKRDYKFLTSHAKVCTGVSQNKDKENNSNNVSMEVADVNVAQDEQRELENAVGSVLDIDADVSMNSSQSSNDEENQTKKK